MGLTKSIQKSIAEPAVSAFERSSRWFGRRGAVVQAATRVRSALSDTRGAGWSRSAVVGSAALGATVAMGAALAYYNVRRSRQDEREHPPVGRFITVDDVRLHYIDKGKGDVVTLIHGNLTLSEDFLLSGIVDMLAERHRVIVFDRPGFGYSERPSRAWTPESYAELLQRALAQLGVERAIVLSHSLGSLVALELALQHPELVEGLVLVAGYFYPTARADAFLMSIAAIPGLGNIIRYTISPPLTRLFLPGVLRWLFSPAAVTESFERGFPNSFAARPTQIRAEVEDGALMAASAAKLQTRYAELKTPIVILTGDGDKMIDLDRQSRRFHKELRQSRLLVIEGAGHMVHHTAPNEVVAAVESVASNVKPRQE
jgi:pimeloyl-ACP methyl ester carboxylesterase